jgi:hypothetical protein
VNFSREQSDAIDQLWNQPVTDSGEPDQILLRQFPSACLERLSDGSIILVIKSGVYDVADSANGAIRVHLFWRPCF